MKKISSLFLIFLLFVSLVFVSSARLLSPTQDEKKVHEISSSHMKEDFSTLMGSEECEGKDDEECLKRREVAEAHLDYIYTQHHKNP